jgi:hypothetical protein
VIDMREKDRVLRRRRVRRMKLKRLRRKLAAARESQRPAIREQMRRVSPLRQPGEAEGGPARPARVREPVES